MKEKEMKKVHWTQTEEGKRKMAAAQKKSWRTRRSKSKAETLIKKKVGKKAVPDRAHLYARAVETAVVAGEVPKLMQALSHACFMDRWMGGGK